jgi:histidinol-phosphate aminotransferase
MNKVKFNRYPDSSSAALRKELSDYLGVEPECIIVGNGSDELIQLLLLCFDATVVYPWPTFSMYKIIAKVVGRREVAVPLNEDFSLNVEALLSCAKKCAPSIIFLPYPNNPTGNCFKREDILRIIKEDFFTVVDEAYFEFCKETFLSILNEFKNLAILRTFSKAFGLAGLRVGYLVTDPQLVRIMNNAKLPFNVDSLASAVATIVLRHRSLLKRQVSQILRWRESLYEEILKMDGVIPYPSRTNFLLLRLKKMSAKDVFEKLLKKGIIVRTLPFPLSDCLRVTVGTPKECRFFLQALREILS